MKNQPIDAGTGGTPADSRATVPVGAEAPHHHPMPFLRRYVFSTDHFVVNWDLAHYVWAIAIAVVIMTVASWIPARRAARVEPAKIIREAT